jgi:mRNA interferase MazF
VSLPACLGPGQKPPGLTFLIFCNYIVSTEEAVMTTGSHPYPTRVPVTLDKKAGWIVLDQIRTIDKKRIIKILGRLTHEEITNVKNIINEMLVQ